MSVEEMLVSLLKAAGITAYPQIAPQGATYPLATYSRVTGVYYEQMDGLDSDRLASCGIQVDIFAGGYAAAKTAAKAARAKLSGFSGIVNGLRVRRIRLTNEMDGFDNPDAGSGSGEFRVIQEYEIWYIDK